MNTYEEAGRTALQILEAIRATHADLIADNLPPGWSMNRLRMALHVDLQSAEIPAFFAAVESTLSALNAQPFAVQVACGADALQAAYLIVQNAG